MHKRDNMLKYTSTVFAGTSQQEIPAVTDPSGENRAAEVGQAVTPQGPIEHPVPCALCETRGKPCVGPPGKTCIVCRVAKKGCEKRMRAQRKQRKPVARKGEPVFPSRKPRSAPTVPHPAMSAVCVEITSKPWISRSSAGGKRKSEMRARSGIGGLPEDNASVRRVLDHTPLRKGKGKAAEKDPDVTPIQTSPKTLDQLAVAVTRRTELLAEVGRVEAQITVLADMLTRERK